ncbi:MAG: hypothetical protein ACLSVD_12775 [Eggerthellaceae bacterium]
MALASPSACPRRSRRSGDPAVTGTPGDQPEGTTGPSTEPPASWPTTLACPCPRPSFSVDPGADPSFTGAPTSEVIGQFGNPSTTPSRTSRACPSTPR